MLYIIFPYYLHIQMYVYVCVSLPCQSEVFQVGFCLYLFTSFHCVSFNGMLSTVAVNKIQFPCFAEARMEEAMKAMEVCA